MSDDCLTADKFNALEDDWSEIVPPIWNGAHVARRVADAFETLGAMPTSGPSRKTSLWPSYPYEFEDLIAQQEGERRPSSWRSSPTIEQITRMEAALCWPARYLGQWPELMRAVNLVARERSRGADTSRLERRTKIPSVQWLRWHGNGCERIARGLIRDKVTVF